jgi:hypothetical protein
MLYDENQETLTKLVEAGDDLKMPRDLDFSVLFQSLTGAECFIQRIGEKSGKVSLSSSESGMFDVTVTFHMIPDIEEICRRERELASAAQPLGGDVDGWGCFPVLQGDPKRRASPDTHD